MTQEWVSKSFTFAKFHFPDKAYYHTLSLWQSIMKILKPNSVKGSANIGVMNSVNGELYSGSSQLEFISKCSVKICNSKDAISH